MKNSEKNSSKVNSSVNNKTLNVETIKAQLKAACVNMTAAQTKEYIKGLDGYSIKQTGANPDRTHATIYFGDMRVCNVENVQGITKDGTARGCSSTKAIKTLHSVLESHMNFLREKFTNELTKEEQTAAEEQFLTLVENCDKIDTIFEAANKRAAEAAAEAAKAKREAAAKERATKKVGKKIAAGTESEKIAAIAAALNVSHEVATKIYKEQKQTA